jgi:hypothetical protein
MLAPDGPVDLTVTRPEDASAIGRHWNAVQRFLEAGDTSGLRSFRRRTVRGHSFATDPDEIERMARIGDLDIEDIYEEIA